MASKCDENCGLPTLYWCELAGGPVILGLSTLVLFFMPCLASPENVDLDVAVGMATVAG